jgi:hypothetical protein
MWRTWIPELVIEVVSARSEHRDYFEKRDEYWTLSVKEYWIVVSKRELVIVLRRGKSDWIEKRLGAADVCTTKLLPGLKVAFKALFDAAGTRKTTSEDTSVDACGCRLYAKVIPLGRWRNWERARMAF